MKGNRRRSIGSAKRSILGSTHAALLVAAGGLLATALVLDGALFGGTTDEIHRHGRLPGVAQTLALVSVALSLGPIGRWPLMGARLRRLDWRLPVVVVVVVVCLVAGQAVVGAGSAFLFSVGDLAWRRFRGADASREASGDNESAR